MRIPAIVLLLVLALPAFGAEAVDRVENVDKVEDEAEGNIAEYDVRFPPQVVIEELHARDLDAQAFILVEGALLLPDAITVIELDRTVTMEIVDEHELERFEPVATFRLPDVLDLAGVVRDQGPQLVEFEQRMWREGMKLARREYDGPKGVTVCYAAFRVEFETTGTYYRASVTLYAPKRSLSESLREMLGKLDEAVKRLVEVRDAVNDAGKRVSTEIQSVQAAVAALEKKVTDAETKLTSLEQAVSSLKQRVR
jgi:hypothetical protein